MRKCDYYRKLTKAAKKKCKNELERYKNVMKEIDNILNNDEEPDKCVVVKSITAYFCGRSSNSWFVPIMSISYSILIGVVAIMPSLGIDKNMCTFMAIFLSAVAIGMAISSFFVQDFEISFVIRVLQDKLDELQNTSNCDKKEQKQAKKSKKKNGNKRE